MSTVDANWTALDGVGFSTEPVVRVWLLALATYGVGDVATTVALVWFSPLHGEANPVVNAAIAAFGGGGLLGVKALAFAVCIGISVWGGLRDDDPFMFYLPPVTLAIVGTATTLFNLNLLL